MHAHVCVWVCTTLHTCAHIVFVCVCVYVCVCVCVCDLLFERERGGGLAGLMVYSVRPMPQNK